MQSIKPRALVVVGAVVMLSSAGSPSAEGHSLVLQGGWPQLEIEYIAPIDLFVDLGLPWSGFFADENYQDSYSTIPLESKIGCQWSFGRLFRLRSGTRLVLYFEQGRDREYEDWETHVEIFLLAEIGVRFEFEFGLVAGLDLPVLGVSDTPILPPDVLRHIYAYVGYTIKL
jgi:hypothetical protein